MQKFRNFHEIFSVSLQMEYIKGMTKKEYQLIYAKKPLETEELRDPDEVSAFLESRFYREYIIDRGIDEGRSLAEIERELSCDKTGDNIKLLEANDKIIRTPGS